ncbi:unnamed protein product [Schistosoma haematobium]|nr:unnamed protein product [Schistosoma haematobium]
MPFVPTRYWSTCATMVWDPVKAPDIRFSSSHFRKQHPRHEKATTLLCCKLELHVQTNNIQFNAYLIHCVQFVYNPCSSLIQLNFLCIALCYLLIFND